MEKKAMEKNSNNRKTRWQAGLIGAALVTLLIVVTLTTCKPMFLQDIAGYVPVYSQVVGPDGGIVTDSRGASVVIPEGALAEETTITIATYEDGSGIYSRHGVTPFTGGADFGPDGITFLKPVTITLPTSRKMVPGQTQPLFMLDPATGAWDMTGFTLTAAADGGYSATAEVTHFTPYVSSLLPPGALSKIEEFFDGTNGQTALGSYMAWFLTATNLYGYTTECGNSVYEVVGLFFDFTWQVDGVSGTAVSQYGDVSLDTVAQLNYSYDTASTAGPEYIYNMLVTVYFDVTENPPEADPNISILEPVPGSTVEGIETISTYIVTGDSDTDIDSVAFYADGSLLGSDDEAPFQWYWDTDGLADGEHTLTATAAFSGGESADSEGVTVVVGDGGGTVAAPVFDPASGEIMPWTEIAITSATEGVSIYYTIDGTTPLQSTGTLYTTPIELSEDSTLKAIAYKDGLATSPVTSGSFTIETVKIVFDSNFPDGGSNQEIFMIDWNGSNLTRLTDSDYANGMAAVSSDGNKIAFYSTRDGVDTHIYIMNADGSDQIKLTNIGDINWAPDFSPNGNRIVFCSDRSSRRQIYTMKVDGSDISQLTSSSGENDDPVYSPDGTKIVFTSDRDGDGEVYIMNADGSNQTNLTNYHTFPLGAPVGDGSPDFSPDGEKIVFCSNRSGFYYNIYIMDSDGTDVVQLTDNTANDMDPSFSSDGEKIVFYSTRDSSWEIYTMNVDGSEQTNITNCWSHDLRPCFVP